MSERIKKARRAWPRIELDEAAFRAYLEEHEATDSSHVDDLFLAFACARGDREALQAFETHFLKHVDEYVRRVDANAAFADEVRQVLRKKLFVTDGELRARITDYSGRGPIGGWLRIAAIRVARDIKRAEARRGPLEREHDQEFRPPSPDPELQLMKSRYAEEFRAAFHATLATLSAKERSVLTFYFFEGMTSSAIGVLYKVEGATVRLWIKQMRGKILDETRRILRERLALTQGELDGVLQMVQSQLDLSISRLLRVSDSE